MFLRQYWNTFFLLFLDIDLSEHYTCIPINYVYAKRTFVHRTLLSKETTDAYSGEGWVQRFLRLVKAPGFALLST